jgi:hypothetical protein
MRRIAPAPSTTMSYLEENSIDALQKLQKLWNDIRILCLLRPVNGDEDNWELEMRSLLVRCDSLRACND